MSECFRRSCQLFNFCIQSKQRHLQIIWLDLINPFLCKQALSCTCLINLAKNTALIEISDCYFFVKDYYNIGALGVWEATGWNKSA